MRQVYEENQRKQILVNSQGEDPCEKRSSNPASFGSVDLFWFN
jgi:hypothetical protein